MASANDKGKKPEEEEPQVPKEEEILVGYEGYMGEDEHPDTRATVASIGLVAQPTQLRRTAQMSTGGRTPRHILAPRTLPPSTPCSNRAGKKHSNLEEWRKNNKDWDPRSELIMGCIEHNSELIRTLTFDMEDLKKLIEELIKRTPPPPKE